MLPGSITFYLFRILSFRLELRRPLDVNREAVILYLCTNRAISFRHTAPAPVRLSILSAVYIHIRKLLV